MSECFREVGNVRVSPLGVGLGMAFPCFLIQGRTYTNLGGGIIKLQVQYSRPLAVIVHVFAFCVVVLLLCNNDYVFTILHGNLNGFLSTNH